MKCHECYCYGMLKFKLFQFVGLFYIFNKRKKTPIYFVLGYKHWQNKYKNSRFKFLPIVVTEDYVLLWGGRRMPGPPEHVFVDCVVINFRYSK